MIAARCSQSTQPARSGFLPRFRQALRPARRQAIRRGPRAASDPRPSPRGPAASLVRGVRAWRARAVGRRQGGRYAATRRESVGAPASERLPVCVDNLTNGCASGSLAGSSARVVLGLVRRHARHRVDSQSRGWGDDSRTGSARTEPDFRASQLASSCGTSDTTETFPTRGERTSARRWTCRRRICSCEPGRSPTA